VVSNRCGLPSAGITALVLNVTVTQPTAGSYITVYPSDAARPLTSNLNFAAGETRPNAVTVRIGSDGRIKIYNAGGNSHVIVDVGGWYGPSASGGSLYNSLAPARILDTRNGTGGVSGKIGTTPLTFKVTGKDGIPASGVSAVALNTTVTEPTGNSFLTLYPADASNAPLASNLNYLPDQTVPNLVTVKVSPSGDIKLYNAVGSTHVILDVAGWYGATGQFFRAVTPARALDTRIGTGGRTGPLSTASDLPVKVITVGGLPTNGALAVALNVTATQPSSGGFLTLYPSDGSRPLASNLNFVAGQTVPNAAITKIDANGRLNIYNLTGQVHVIVDVAGWFGP
jgi:hypothetical protein